MSDFPASESPRIPWGEAVNRAPLGSTSAPGPPVKQQPNKGKKQTPQSNKMAANLGGCGAGGGGWDRQEDNAAASSQQQDEWDPMTIDYRSTEFNSYTHGMGSLMQASCGGKEQKDITLFVSNVSTSLTKDGLRNLFSRAGAVKKAHTIKPKQPTQSTTYGFVEFETVREADKAIQMFDNFDIGDGVKLGVKVSVKPEERDRRQAKKQEEERFIRTLNCGRQYKEQQTTSTNDYELNDQEEETSRKNPFLPSYKPRPNPPTTASGEPSINGSEKIQGAEEEAEGLALGRSAGASSLRAAATSINQSSPQHKNPSESPGSSRHDKVCHICSTPCSMSCTQCKTAYCSRKCQERDWPEHRLVCKKIKHQMQEGKDVDAVSPTQNGHNGVSQSPVIREQENSEDESGFDIPTPPIEELMSVLQGEASSGSKSRTSPPQGALKTPKHFSSLGNSPTTPPFPNETPPNKNNCVQRSTPSSNHTPSPSPAAITPIITLPLTLTSSNGIVPTLPPAPNSLIGNSMTLTNVLYVFQSSSLPLLSIPLGSPPPVKFNAVLTHAFSCNRFSVVLMSVESKQALKTIQACGNSSLPHADTLALVPGSKVGYLDQNEDLYRMEVLKIIITENTIILNFYDFGGHISLPLPQNRLVVLPEEVVTLPCLQLHCTINGIFIQRRFGADYLTKVVGHTPLQITKVNFRPITQRNFYVYICDVRLSDSQTDLRSMLEDYISNYASTQSLPNPPPLVQTPGKGRVAPLTTAAPSPLTPPIPTNPSSSQSPYNPCMKPGMSQRIPSQSSQYSSSTSSDRYKLMHPVRGVPRHSPPKDKEFTIIPIVVNSPSSMWAQVKHSQLHILHRMQKDLNQSYSNRKNDSYSPSVGELCVARHCEDQQFYRAEVLCVNNNGTVDVRFVDFGNREMVLLSQLQHLESVFLSLPIQALHLSMDSIIPSGHALNWTDNAVTYLKNKILRRDVQARIVDQRNNLFVVSLSDPESPDQSVEELMVHLGHADSTKPAQQQNQHQKFASVTTDSSENRTPHRAASHSDFSTASTVVNQPHPKPPSPSLNSGSNTAATTRKLPFGVGVEGGFESLTRTTPSPAGAPPTPPSTPPNPPSESGDVIPFPHKASPSPRPPSSQERPLSAGASSFPQRSSSPQVFSTRVQVPTLSVPHHKSPAMITFVESPFSFFLQILDRSALNELKELTEKLNLSSLAPFPDPQPKDFCVARYAEDDVMYRCMVVERESSRVSVKFIDYGNVEIVNCSDVFQLPTECAHLPSQAIFCALNYFRLTPTPEPEADKYFKSLVMDQQVWVKASKVLNDDQKKTLVDMKLKDGEEDVLKLMEERGFNKSQQRKGSRGKQQQQQSGSGRREGGFRRGSQGYQSEDSFSGMQHQRSQDSSPQKMSFASIKTDDGVQGSSNQQHQTQQKQVPWKDHPQNQHNKTWDRPLEESLSTQHRSSHTTSAPPAADFPPLSSLAATELPTNSEYVEVAVTDISSPLLLHLQIASPESLQIISDLQSGLNCCAHAPPPSLPPSQGSVCCCKFRDDGLWYRGVITGSHGSLYNVEFIDYGNSDQVLLSAIAPCPPKFLKPPRMAVKCGLSGVALPHPGSQSWPREALPFLQEKCLDRVLLAKIESRQDGTGLPLVQLIDTSSSSDIYMTSELITAGLATATSQPAPTPIPASMATPTPESVATPTPAGPLLVVTHLPEMELPSSDQFDVLVTSVSGPCAVYLHPVTADTAYSMAGFPAEITDHCSSAPLPPTPPIVGQFCLAQFSDGGWYRAKVNAALPNGTLDVFFVDFGNKDNVTITQTRPIQEKFTSLPILSIKCALYGLLPKEALNSDPAALSTLLQLSASSKLVCRVVSHFPLLVDLLLPSTSESVRVELSHEGHFSLPPPVQSFTLPPASPFPASSKVIITHVEALDSFWLQAIDTPEISQLPALMEKVGLFCSSVTPSSTTPMRLGMLCFAQFTEDQVWYRARVTSFSSLTDCCVQFIDFGNSQVTPLSAILPAPTDLLSAPGFALHCCLEGWEGGRKMEDGRRSEDTLTKFKSMVENKCLMAVSRGTHGGKVIVGLVDSSGGQEIHIRTQIL